jgi:hypothetical protein
VDVEVVVGVDVGVGMSVGVGLHAQDIPNLNIFCLGISHN